ncbi:MAG TPA: oligoendopeptidase F [Limnochordia bacterium]
MATEIAEAPQKLPKRHEVAEAYRWRLEDLYPDDEAWERDFQSIKEMIPRIEAYRGRLSESGAVLLEALRLQDEVSQKLEKLYVYAHTRRDEDSTNPRYQAVSDRAEGLIVRLNAATAFFVPEIVGLSDETVDRFFQSEPGLSHYRHYIADIRRQKPHTLSPAEEALLAEVGEVAKGPRTIFGMLNDADLKFPTIRDEANREVELTKGRYLRFMESRDRRVRKEAFEALYATYGKLENTLASILAASVKKDVFYARARRYGSALEAALSPDNIPLAVYENLIRAVRDRLDVMHRYVALRKRALQLPELHMYDLYTPIVPEVKIEIPFEKATAIVEQALAPLGEDYLARLKQGLTDRWIDVFETEGKRSGAYSTGAYGQHPYVLMNYQGTVHDLFTLAHEMGHAIHTHYSDERQPYVYAQYTIFVAEVASTLNETLLVHHLLKTIEDPRERLYILNHYLEEFRGTVYRQTMFAEFEKWMHEKVEAGEALTPEVLSQRYLELNRDYYGPEMVVDESIRLEWARIPHFYSAFYVYKYATGFSAATALARQILDEGRPAVERYLTFLQSGSSDYSIELLRRAGVDMATPEPIHAALGEFDRWLGEMERLLPTVL